MVTRKTHNYKERKPMATFGQFILPLAALMALALLFFSVKLFFLDPNDASMPIENQIATEQPRSNDDKKNEVAPTGQTIVKKEEKKTSPVVIAKPVDANKSEVKQETKAIPTDIKQEKIPPKTTIQQNTAKTGTVQPASVKQQPSASLEEKGAGRWDVQIGGFSSKNNAQQIFEKAKEQGYDVYMIESVFNNAPFYKVRVKGANNKDDAQKISSKLQEKGYPVYLVEIK
ncbi:MAG: SPOR domain-containing protein [Synergistaceae bacterium]|nr:SPOR domain-containing protein [Synergistaceae bacterium]